jgi:hypothetical protein
MTGQSASQLLGLPQSQIADYQGVLTLLDRQDLETILIPYPSPIDQPASQLVTAVGGEIGKAGIGCELEIRVESVEKPVDVTGVPGFDLPLEPFDPVARHGPTLRRS